MSITTTNNQISEFKQSLRKENKSPPLPPLKIVKKNKKDFGEISASMLRKGESLPDLLKNNPYVSPNMIKKSLLKIKDEQQSISISNIFKKNQNNLAKKSIKIERGLLKISDESQHPIQQTDSNIIFTFATSSSVNNKQQQQFIQIQDRKSRNVHNRSLKTLQPLDQSSTLIQKLSSSQSTDQLGEGEVQIPTTAQHGKFNQFQTLPPRQQTNLITKSSKNIKLDKIPGQTLSHANSSSNIRKTLNNSASSSNMSLQQAENGNLLQYQSQIQSEKLKARTQQLPTNVDSVDSKSITNLANDQPLEYDSLVDLAQNLKIEENSTSIKVQNKPPKPQIKQALAFLIKQEHKHQKTSLQPSVFGVTTIKNHIERYVKQNFNYSHFLYDLKSLNQSLDFASTNRETDQIVSQGMKDKILSQSYISNDMMNSIKSFDNRITAQLKNELFAHLQSPKIMKDLNLQQIPNQVDVSMQYEEQYEISERDKNQIQDCYEEESQNKQQIQNKNLMNVTDYVDLKLHDDDFNNNLKSQRIREQEIEKIFEIQIMNDNDRFQQQKTNQETQSSFIAPVQVLEIACQNSFIEEQKQFQSVNLQTSFASNQKLTTPRNESNIIQFKIVSQKTPKNLNDQGTFMGHSFKRSIIDIIDEVQIPESKQSLNPLDFQNAVFELDIQNKSKTVHRKFERKRIFKNQFDFLFFCIDIYRDMLSTNQNNVLYRAVRQKILKIGLNAYQKYVEEKDKEFIIKSYKRNQYKEKMMQQFNQNAKPKKDIVNQKTEKNQVKENRQQQGTKLPPKPTSPVMAKKSEKQLTPIFEGFQDHDKFPPSRPSVTIQILNSEKKGSDTMPLHIGNDNTPKVKIQADDEISSIRNKNQNNPRISNSSTGSNFIDNLMFQLKKQYKDPDSGNQIKKDSSNSDLSQAFHQKESIISPQTRGYDNIVGIKSSQIQQDNSTIEIKYEIGEVIATASGSKKKSFNIIEDKYEDSMEGSEQSSRNIASRNQQKITPSSAIKTNSHMSIYYDELNSDEEEKERIDEVYEQDESSESKEKSPQTFRDRQIQDIKQPDFSIVAKALTRNKTKDLEIQVQKQHTTQSMKRVTQINTSGLMIKPFQSSISPITQKMPYHGSSDKIDQAVDETRELSKTNIVTQPRRMTLKPEDAISPNRLNLTLLKNKSPMALTKGLTIYSHQKSIISGKSQSPSGASQNGKPDLKTFVNVFQDLDATRQKQILKALEPHLKQAQNSQTGPLKLKTYADFVKQSSNASKQTINNSNSNIIQYQ